MQAKMDTMLNSHEPYPEMRGVLTSMRISPPPAAVARFRHRVGSAEDALPELRLLSGLWVGGAPREAGLPRGGGGGGPEPVSEPGARAELPVEETGGGAVAAFGPMMPALVRPCSI